MINLQMGIDLNFSLFKEGDNITISSLSYGNKLNIKKLFIELKFYNRGYYG